MPELRILIVDDEPSIREALHRWFEVRGFEADVAADGIDAIERFHERRHDVVTLDLDMPRMDGVEAFVELRALAPGLPIVIMTGCSDRSRDPVLQRANRVLTKPVSLRVVEREVRRALQASSCLR